MAEPELDPRDAQIRLEETRRDGPYDVIAPGRAGDDVRESARRSGLAAPLARFSL